MHDKTFVYHGDFPQKAKKDILTLQKKLLWVASSQSHKTDAYLRQVQIGDCEEGGQRRVSAGGADVVKSKKAQRNTKK